MNSNWREVLPRPFIKKYRKLLGDESEEFFSSLMRPLRRSIRINTLKGDLGELVEKLSHLSLTPLPFYRYGFYTDFPSPGATLEHYLGLYYVQEASAMLPVLVLDPQPGERVLDIAAAPGGKTTQICQHMEGVGVVVANEVDQGRQVTLRGNIQRMGCHMAVITGMDGRFLRPPPTYDRVLVDPPCSSEGTIRRNFSALKGWSSELSNRMVHIQRGLLRSGIEVLKEGGVLVYSTCTFAPEENEGVVSWALERFNVELEEVRIKGIEADEGIGEWGGVEYPEEVRRCARIYPHRTDTGGFFIARMRKRGE
ncbi:MAG: RsmB/NOP family class I SAM-dependent RNA methyltransferase [Thermoplasmata archaeon]|nr:RsmB/NOP family class I SAM-dependent RNA methyltransferase [Thermoplasmata archaeon]